MLTPAQIRKLRNAAPSARNRVAVARELAGLTQVELAGKLGTSQSRVSDIERGEYSDLPLETTRTWASFFGVHVEDLFPAPVSQVAS